MKTVCFANSGTRISGRGWLRTDQLRRTGDLRQVHRDGSVIGEPPVLDGLSRRELVGVCRENRVSPTPSLLGWENYSSR